MRLFLVLSFATLFLCGTVYGDKHIGPTQKTETFATPAQKTVDAVPQKTSEPVPAATQKTFAGPTQKSVPMTAVQKGPVQKGTMSAYTLAEVPTDLIERLRMLERQPCQPVRNLGRGIARCIIKKKIGQAIEDHLPPGPPLP